VRQVSAENELRAAQAASELASLRSSSAMAMAQLQSELDAARHASAALTNLSTLSTDALSTVPVAAENSKSAALLAAKQATEQAQAELAATREELNKAAAAEMDAAVDSARRQAAKDRATVLRSVHEEKLAALREAQQEMLEALRVAHEQKSVALQEASKENVASLSAVNAALAAVEEETETLRRHAATRSGVMATAGYHIDQAIHFIGLRPFEAVGGMWESAFGWTSDSE